MVTPSCSMWSGERSTLKFRRTTSAAGCWRSPFPRRSTAEGTGRSFWSTSCRHTTAATSTSCGSERTNRLKPNRSASRRGGSAAGNLVHRSDGMTISKGDTVDIYDRLGVRRVLNAQGSLSKIGGSLMAPEVLAAMGEAAQSFVEISEFLDKAGRHLAALIGVEAAFICSGAAAGLVLSTAACVAGKDPAKIFRLPDTQGMKNEVIIHRQQRNHYDSCIRQAGVKLVEIGLARETHPWELENAISERTAAVVYFVAYARRNTLTLPQVVAIAHAARVPVIVDAADELPPATNLRRFTDEGADLAIFSGGKAIGGPQASGLILGNRDLIEACAVNAFPNYAIGRPMKIGKEEIAGL